MNYHFGESMTKVRYVCRDCNRRRGGGYFSLEEDKEPICPYCGSKNVKRLSK